MGNLRYTLAVLRHFLTEVYVCWKLSDEVGHYRFFLDGVRDAGGAACFDTFEEPCHVAAELSHHLHSFLVLAYLIWGVAVYHVPVF